MSKIPLVLFSGGLDSTYQLANLLRTTSVDVLSIDCQQHEGKLVMESQAREKIIALLHARNREYFTPYHVEAQRHFMVNRIAHFSTFAFAQVSAWLFAALEFVDHTRHSEVVLSYVLGDSIASQIPYIEQAWEALQRVAKIDVVPMRFPLIYTSKAKLLELMDEELKTLIWYCETPIQHHRHKHSWRACGGCEACLTHALAKHRNVLQAEHHHALNTPSKGRRKREKVSLQEIGEIIAVKAPYL